MRSFRAVLWFKALIFIATLAGLSGVTFGFPPLSVALFAGILCVGLGFWVAANACIDLRLIVNLLEGLGRESGAEREESAAAIPTMRAPARDLSRVLLDMTSVKRLGDRVFKADAIKVCQTCKHLKAEDRICLLDHVSLQGTTIGAVGCQHWTPGLKVTEPVELPRPEPLEGANGVPPEGS
ncbi:MAG: hypothetical protein GHCLOJNM_04451 [bacterium]|nr:hypothetical protein [bacterium]